MRLQRNDVSEARIFHEFDLSSAGQNFPARCHFAQSGFLVEAGIDSLHANRYEAAARQSRPFTADDCIGMKILKRDRSEEVTAEGFCRGNQNCELVVPRGPVSNGLSGLKPAKFDQEVAGAAFPEKVDWQATAEGVIPLSEPGRNIGRRYGVLQNNP